MTAGRRAVGGGATGQQHVATFSGGVGSWAAARRVAERHGTDNLTLLFTDTLIEDTDLYRFLIEAACNVFDVPAPADLVKAALAMPEFHEDEAGRVAALTDLRERTKERLPFLAWIAEGRDPWTIFFAERFLGNSRADPCSKILKRQAIDCWLAASRSSSTTAVYVGIDWSEKHRFTGLRDRRLVDGWRYEAPLCEPPFLTKVDIYGALRAHGIRRPRLYTLGLSHNNCGGGCIKAGQGHWVRVYHALPAVFAWWEAKEQAIREYLGKPVSILTDRSGDGKKKPLTLADLRQRIERGAQVDMFDVGGCGCFSDDAPEAAS
ncbi:MAG TPA: hypothetical protein VMT30_09375 [Candidatus Saccharimonadia bacterium]|nr:hypothetical protein [Candidatus Saccharimonadia bacterium]